MKKLLIVIIFSMFFSFNLKADIGFGFILGEPTGLTIKSRTGDNDLLFNLGISDYGEFRIDGLYSFNFPDAFNDDQFGLYIAVGPVIAFGEAGHGIFYGGHKNDDHDHRFRDHDDNLGIAAKGVFGLLFTPSKKWEIFLELGPIVGVVPHISGGFEAAIGVRFFP